MFLVETCSQADVNMKLDVGVFFIA